MCTGWTDCEICCHCHFQRAGPAGPSGPTATPTEPSYVCVIVMSCSPLETSVQETTVRPGPALPTPTSYLVITRTRPFIVLAWYSCLNGRARTHTHTLLFSNILCVHAGLHHLHSLHYPPAYAHGNSSFHSKSIL